ncbi:MAG TPA: hypothetical protein VFP60_06125 [Pseudolabrys sp.]|nr:hypothetical protein [Pseudolabrys sp.]
MSERKDISPELMAGARHLYEQTITPVEDISAMLGISKRTFARRAAEQGWRRRHAMPQRRASVRAAPEAAKPLHAEVQPLADHPQGDDRAQTITQIALAQRVQNAVEREIEAVERILQKIMPADQGEAERSARALASVSRALSQIVALNQTELSSSADATDDDPIPDDEDEYRAELTRRIKNFMASRYGAG